MSLLILNQNKNTMLLFVVTHKNNAMWLFIVIHKKNTVVIYLSFLLRDCLSTKKWKYRAVRHKFKKVNFILWIGGFHRRADSRTSHSHLQFKKAKTTGSHLTLAKVPLIEQSMEQAQHHSSAIEQKSTLSNIESRRIKCSPLPSPFTT